MATTMRVHDHSELISSASQQQIACANN